MKYDYDSSGVEPQKKKGKKGKGCLISSIVLFVIVAAFAIWTFSTLDDSTDTTAGPDETHDYFTAETYQDDATESAQEYITEIYCENVTPTFHMSHQRTWFNEFEYDFATDDVYASDDYVYGYYVCEGQFDYDIAGDGAEAVPVDYTATIWCTDNANGYRFSLRTIELKYDGVQIDYRKNMDFFTE